jgi:hypothetical protein
MIRPNNSCVGCIHWRSANGEISDMKFCHFVFDMGKLRRVPAEDCTFWDGLKKTTKRKKKLDAEKPFSELYDSKMNDAQIARATGKSAATVLQWRKRNGLPAIGLPNFKQRRLDREQASGSGRQENNRSCPADRPEIRQAYPQSH